MSPQRHHPGVPSSHPVLAGRGGREGLDVRCPKCHGSGMEVIVHQLGPNMVHHIQAMCSQCQGQGEWLRPLDRCLACNGRKVVREKKVLNVHLDKGELGGGDCGGAAELCWLPCPGFPFPVAPFPPSWGPLHTPKEPVQLQPPGPRFLGQWSLGYL